MTSLKYPPHKEICAIVFFLLLVATLVNAFHDYDSQTETLFFTVFTTTWFVSVDLPHRFCPFYVKRP